MCSRARGVGLAQIVYTGIALDDKLKLDPSLGKETLLPLGLNGDYVHRYVELQVMRPIALRQRFLGERKLSDASSSAPTVSPSF